MLKLPITKEVCHKVGGLKAADSSQQCFGSNSPHSVQAVYCECIRGHPSNLLLVGVMEGGVISMKECSTATKEQRNANGGGGGLRGRSCELNGMMFNRGRDRCLAQTLGNR